MFEFCFNVFFLNFFTYIEATAAGTCVTFLTDIMSCLFLLLIFVQTFLCTDSQITILQVSLYFIFGKSRKIYDQFIAFISFLDIRFSLYGWLCVRKVSSLYLSLLCHHNKWKISKKSSNKFSPKILGINISHLSFSIPSICI